MGVHNVNAHSIISKAVQNSNIAIMLSECLRFAYIMQIQFCKRHWYDIITMICLCFDGLKST